MTSQLLINDAIVDAVGVAKTLGDLLKRFSLLNLLDYCMFVEGIALYDRLVIISTTRLEGSGIAKAIQTQLKPWFEAGVLVFDELLTPFGDSTAFANKIMLLKKKSLLRGAPLDLMLEDALFEAERLVSAEQARRRPALPLLRQSPFYELSAIVPQDHAVCDLIGKYRSLKKAVEAIRDDTAIELQPYLGVPIPPLALSALRRCKHPEDVLVAALEVRDQYSSLRRSLGNLREVLFDPTVSPNKKQKHIESWQRSWKSLEDYSRSAAVLHLATSSNEMLDATKLLNGIDIDDIKWSTVVRKLLEKAERGWYSWRVRMLHRTAKRYLATADHEMNALVEAVFRHQVDQHEVDMIKRFTSALRSPQAGGE